MRVRWAVLIFVVLLSTDGTGCKPSLEEAAARAGLEQAADKIARIGKVPTDAVRRIIQGTSKRTGNLDTDIALKLEQLVKLHPPKPTIIDDLLGKIERRLATNDESLHEAVVDSFCELAMVSLVRQRPPSDEE